MTVFENRRALPRAWFVNAVTVASDDDAIRAVQDGVLPGGVPFSPRSDAIVDPAIPLTPSRFTPGRSEARLTRVGDGEISLAVSTEGGGLMVLSENAYPGWVARIDGAATPIYRVDVALQAIMVPPGTHRVAFTMESRSLRAGMIVSAGAILACLVLAIV